jgi:hypothetical protein
MSFLRSSTTLTSFSRRAARAPLSIRQLLPINGRSISSTSPRFAQGYGDGEGDPKGENPQDQGASNSVKHNAEHPGPAPPAEGQGKGGGPTKGTGKNPEDVSAQSGGSRSKEAKETGSSPTGGEIADGGKSQIGASPKVHDRSEPGTGDEGKKAEVEQHNKEFKQRHDRAQEAESDKVDKKFWQG